MNVSHLRQNSTNASAAFLTGMPRVALLET
jgi:hypothetical protein